MDVHDDRRGLQKDGLVILSLAGYSTSLVADLPISSGVLSLALDDRGMVLAAFYKAYVYSSQSLCSGNWRHQELSAIEIDVKKIEGLITM